MARRKTTSKTKHCIKCDKTKSRKYFYSTSAYCKKCQRQTVMDNQKENADYYNQYRSEYSKHNPEKRRAWKKITIERWEERHGIKYKDHALQRHKERFATDPEYREKVRERRRAYRTRNKEKYDQYRIAYYTDNRALLLLKAKIKYCERRMQLAVDSKVKKDYEKRIKAVRKQIKALKKK